MNLLDQTKIFLNFISPNIYIYMISEFLYENGPQDK